MLRIVFCIIDTTESVCLVDGWQALNPVRNHTAAKVQRSLKYLLVLANGGRDSPRPKQIAEGNVRNLQRSSEAWATLGWIQLQLGDPASAEKSLANAAQLGPPFRDAVYYLWQFKKAQGDAQAPELLQKAFAETAGHDFFSTPDPLIA